MQTASSPGINSGKLKLWTFGVFGITLLMVIGCTWLITWKSCEYSSRQVFQTLEKSLQTSKNFLYGDIRAMDHELQKKQYDPATKEKANIWKPISNTAIAAMNRLDDQISVIEKQIQQKNGLELSEKKRLLDSVKLFYATITSPLPEDKRESLGKLPVSYLIDSLEKEDNWFHLFKTENNPEILLALLTKLQFESSASAYIVADFCNQQVRYIDEGYDVFNVLIGQNAQQLLPNKTLQITAGVGAYSSWAKPEIIIDGVRQDLSAYGLVFFEKKVNKSGSVPVSVSYKDPNTGELKKMSTNVDYIVAKPSNQ